MRIELWALLGVTLVLLFAIGTLCRSYVRIRREQGGNSDSDTEDPAASRRDTDIRGDR